MPSWASDRALNSPGSSSPGAQIRRTVRDPAEIKSLSVQSRNVGSILSKLRLTPSESDTPRVLAVLSYLSTADSVIPNRRVVRDGNERWRLPGLRPVAEGSAW